MQSNEKCMKAILKYIDDNTGVEINQTDNTVALKIIGFSTIMKELSANGEFTAEEVACNLIKCHRFYLIKADIPMNGRYITIEKSTIYDLTPEGERFLNNN